MNGVDHESRNIACQHSIHPPYRNPYSQEHVGLLSTRSTTQTGTRGSTQHKEHHAARSTWVYLHKEHHADRNTWVYSTQGAPRSQDHVGLLSTRSTTQPGARRFTQHKEHHTARTTWVYSAQGAPRNRADYAAYIRHEHTLVPSS